jgi:hypothetical protein
LTCFWTIFVVLPILWLLGFSPHIGGGLLRAEDRRYQCCTWGVGGWNVSKQFYALPPLIGILMAAEGRFLQCIKCRLTLKFPAGAHYDTIVKRFESELWSPPMLSTNAVQRLTCPK